LLVRAAPNGFAGRITVLGINDLRGHLLFHLFLPNFDRKMQLSSKFIRFNSKDLNRKYVLVQ
jgi:hypothetical protein